VTTKPDRRRSLQTIDEILERTRAVLESPYPGL
jgi:hypothetical protein